MNTPIYLFFIICIGQTLGFALRIYPGFKLNPADRMASLYPPGLMAYNNGISRNIIPVRMPILEETSTPADPETLVVTSDPGLKAITYRRAGPLDQCDNYLDCKSRLLSYLDNMMKISNKG